MERCLKKQKIETTLRHGRNLNIVKHFEIISNIQIFAEPFYLERESSIMHNKHVFVYHVKITNLSTVAVQLMRRHWDIHDDFGEDFTIEGEGVIGRQPVILPGETHSYQSFSVLKGMSGSMSGWYEMELDDRTRIQVPIPRMTLSAHLLN